MPWSVFWETLRRDWRATLLWGGALAFFGLFTTAILPDPEGMKQIVDALDVVPAFLWQLLGVDDLSIIVTPAGFIGLRYFLTATMLVAVWAVMAGLNVTVNDETRGIANMLVSLPLPRWRIIAEKMLAHIPLAVLVPLGGFAGLLIGIALNPNAQTDLPPLLLATLNLTPTALLILSLTVVIGAVIPRRGVVGGLAGGFVAVSFILKSVAGLAKSDFGDAMAQLSIFKHADALAVIRDGIAPLPSLILLILAASVAYAAVVLFQRRDLAA